MTTLQQPVGPGREIGAPNALHYLTISIASQLLGVPVLLVHDVLASQRITRVPLAPPAVLGSLNLRGRIVTAVDVRRRLGLQPRDPQDGRMMIVVEHRGELYSLVVDSVGEVLPLSANSLAPTPVTLAPLWRNISRGIHRLEEKLLIVLDIDELLAGTADMADRTAAKAVLPTAA